MKSKISKYLILPTLLISPLISCQKTEVKIYIKWVNYDDSVLQLDENLDAGAIPNYSSETPTKEGDELNQYVFKGWNRDITQPVYKNTIIKAEFDISYLINFYNYDKKTLLYSTYTIDNQIPDYKGPTPKRDGDKIYRKYTFKGWNEDLKPATEPKFYYATYEKTYKNYKITFNYNNGDPIESIAGHYGDLVYPSKENPTKKSEGAFNYKFKCWEPEITPILENMDYEAIYDTQLNTLSKYPQNVVTDENLISELDKLKPDPKTGYINYNDNDYYKYKSEHSYISNDNHLINGDEYHYYLVDDIDLITLQSEDNNVSLVMTEKIIDATYYDDYTNNYKDSFIRGFFNDNITESTILETNVDNSATSTGYSDNPYACEDTNDKVFSLSVKELSTLPYFTEDLNNRKAKLTDFANAKGVANEGGFGAYWTRSPSKYDENKVRYVNTDGSISNDDFAPVNQKNMGVRPAFRIQLS